MRHFFTLLSLVVCGTSIAVGQPAKPGRSCRILFLSPTDTTPKSVFLNDGTTSQEVELPSLNLSKVYSLAPGDVTLRLSSALPTAEQPLPAGAPSIPLPGGIKDCYLLVASDPKNKVVPLQCQIINANPDGFGLGEMMWINLTPYQVGGQLGSQSLLLKPQSQMIMKSPSNVAGGYPVKMGYSPGKDQKAVAILSTQWVHNPGGRNVVFVMMTPNTKVPRIKGFSDYREPTPQQGQ